LLSGRWSRLLAFKPLQVVGIICYSIYLWHLTVSNLVARFGLGRGLINAVITVGVLTVVAPISYRPLEAQEKLPWWLRPTRAKEVQEQI